MKNLRLLLCAFLFCSACSNDDDGFQNVITPILIGKGNLYGNGSEGISKQNMVITDANTWQQLMNQMNSSVKKNLSETDIDFSSFAVIAVFSEIKTSGGHSIDIIKIVEKNSTVEVTIDNLLKGDLTSVITQPYHVVKIPKPSKAVVFKQ
jgi:hypothetical protein